MKSKIEYVSIDTLIPYARNARTHSDAQVAQIAASITEFGWTNPILTDGVKGVIAGHGRLLAARKLGNNEVPIIELSHLTDSQKRAYIIADNKLSLNAGWDDEVLSVEMEELDDEGFDLTLTGFGDEELEGLLEKENTGLTDDDAVPEVPDNPVSKLGDIWELGNHRVMCGDSTSIDTVDLLMNGQKADMVFTDPPYGMSYGGGRAAGSTKKGAKVKAHGMIIGDDLRGDDLNKLISDSISKLHSHSKTDAAFYVCFPWRTYTEFYGALSNIGLEPNSCIVWDKKSIGLGQSNYRPQHEFIFYVKGGAWYGDKAQSDVWYMSRGATGEYVHPTQKPVELVEKTINNSSKGGDLIGDCFGGSGSTLIACEKTGRVSYSMELDPKYVDVIINRWQDFTGKEATLDGVTFKEVENERTNS
tara:strand:- start:2 stop:1252 length:1251 start_codon:yes stop_codon:yes gene_type:complete